MLSTGLSPSLLHFCEGVRFILVPSRHGDGVLERPEVEVAVRILSEAIYEKEGSAPANLWDALKLRDKDSLRSVFADLLGPLIENPFRVPQLWKKLVPDEVLLSPGVFERDAKRVVALRSDAYFSQYAIQRLSGSTAIEPILEPESLIDTVAATRGIFEGAATYARVRGAFSIAEKLLWWVAVAFEKDNKDSREFPQINNLKNIYQETGRPVSAHRLAAVAALKQKGGVERWMDWKRRLQSEAVGAEDLFQKFLKLGDYSIRRTAVNGYAIRLKSLYRDMFSDPITYCMVVESALLMTPRDGRYNKAREDNIIHEKGIFPIRMSYPQFIPRGNLFYFNRNRQFFNQGDLICGESSLLPVYPLPMDELVNLYRPIVVVMQVLSDHMQACEKQIIENPNPRIETLERQLVAAQELLDAFHEGESDMKEGDLKVVRSCLLTLELIHYWVGCYMTPIGKQRTQTDAILERLRQDLLPYYQKALRILRQQLESDTKLGPRFYMRLRQDCLYDRRISYEGEDVSQILVALEDCQSQAALSVIASIDSPDRRRGLVAAILEDRNEIEMAYEQKSNIENLILFLDQLWALSNEDVDVALWACELDRMHFENGAHVERNHRRLIAIYRYAGPTFGLAHMLDRVAPEAIYENHPTY